MADNKLAPKNKNALAQTFLEGKFAAPEGRNYVLGEELKTKLGDLSGLNLSLPAYTRDVTQVTPFYGKNYQGGFVNRNAPGVVNINPRSMFDAAGTLGHEAEHLQQHGANAFISQALKDKNYPANIDLLGTGRTSQYRNENLDALMSSAQQAQEKYKDKYKLSGDFANSEAEFMADMVGLESTLPKGQSVLNTDIGKDIFNTPEKRHYFLASSFPNTTKALEYDPRLFTLAAQKATQALQEFKNKALHDSYFNAAIAAVRKLSGNQ